MQADTMRSLRLEHVCTVGCYVAHCMSRNAEVLFFNSWLSGCFFWGGEEGRGPDKGPGLCGETLLPSSHPVMCAGGSEITVGCRQPGHVQVCVGLGPWGGLRWRPGNMGLWRL